tara:strand:- start:2402 stop:2647 length:246 start_codon:yes stop_codon:yes gene_type:complete
VKDFIDGRKIPEEERLRLNLESMTYMIMTHYGWNIKEVQDMNINQIKQAVSWASAMVDNQNRQDKGEGVYLSYDNVPPLGE